MNAVIKRLICTLAGSGLGLMLVGAAHAETRVFGDYQVHYSVFQSSLLPPSAASAYGIVRATDRALLNIVVQRGNGDPVHAKAIGTLSDLIYTHALVFREVREEQAIYYLADFEFVDAETLYFDIEIQPEGEPGPLSLKFSHTLYTD